MTTAAPRNIHAIAAAESRAQPHPARQRAVTNNPLREYAARPGRVEPLADSVAAMILSRKGTVRIERHQAKVSIDGVERYYSAPDSVVIAEYNGTGRPVTWYANSRKPDCIHLCTPNGVYLETLPLKNEATWFSADAGSKAAHAEAVSHRNRSRRRLEELKGPEIAAAIAREKHNAAELERRIRAGEQERSPREDERAVHIFSAPLNSQPSTLNIPPSTRADTVVAAMRSAEGQRARHTATLQTDARRAASAAQLGAAVRREREVSPAENPTPAAHAEETWDERESAAPQPENVEIW